MDYPLLRLCYILPVLKRYLFCFKASFNPSESGEVGASYGSTPGPSSAVAGGVSGAEAASKEEEINAASDDYPKILLMGLRRSGKSSITKV